MAKKKVWDIDELKYLTAAMDCMADELNPNLFLNSKGAYLDELKNYYLKHKDEWIGIAFRFQKR